jgi:VWFA-related protein
LVRKDVNEVYFLFTASVHGEFVSDLVATDVTVLDDRKAPEAVLGFYSQRDIPVRIGVLVDTSGSVSSQFHQEQAAAGMFLADLVRPRRDMAFVMGFSDISEVKQDFTNNPGELWRGITTLTDEEHGTALFDAVIEGCRKLTAHHENQFVARALIILSDGEENSSRNTLDDAIRAAQMSDVTVYAIWTRGPDLVPYGDNEALKKLTTESGGRALSPRSPDKFGSALAQLAAELHSRYAIAYRPANFNMDGRYRAVRITAKKRGKKVKVHARKGYYAEAHTTKITGPAQFMALEP